MTPLEMLAFLGIGAINGRRREIAAKMGRSPLAAGLSEEFARWYEGVHKGNQSAMAADLDDGGWTVLMARWQKEQAKKNGGHVPGYFRSKQYLACRARAGEPIQDLAARVGLDVADVQDRICQWRKTLDMGERSNG